MSGERPPLLGAAAQLTVRTVSDWHVGAGTGIPGAIDAQVRRARDGLPYLPGTTLTGVLRDACRTVARALDNGMPGPWLRWHRLIFGDTPDQDGPTAGRRLRSAALAIGPARLDAPLRAVVSSDPALARATTFVKPGVRIDPDTGRAQDDMLRFVEMARAGLPLQAQATLDLPDDEDAATAITALLVLGAAWCDRVGGDRRRGAGQVSLIWDGLSAPGWAKWLRGSGWSPKAPKPQPQPRSQSGVPASPRGGWVTVPLVITTEQPLRVPRQTTGNLVRGYDHVPGSLLLPWLSQRLGADQVRAAVGADALTVRHTYPEITGERSVPAPFVLARARHPQQQPDGSSPILVYNTMRQHPPANVPTKQIRGSWTLPRPVDTDGLLLANLELEQRSHNAVSRATQRPDSETGLYTVEVIPAGQRLRTELLLAEGVAAEIAARLGPRWWTVLDGPARLGARRRGEYGAVHAQATPPHPTVPATNPPRQGELWELWVLADLVVRSRRLRLSADPLDVCAALRTRLDGGGLELALEAGSVARTQRRDSWQSAWQLPRESVVGVAAGSVLRVQVTSGVIDAAAWADVLRRGLGERRAEGFGEVLIGAPLLTSASLRLVPADTATTQEVQPAGELTAQYRSTLDVLTRVARDATVRDSARALRELADPPAGYTTLRAALGRLSASQRGTWRTVLTDAVHRRDRQRADGELRRWQHYRGDRRGDQKVVAAAISALLGGGITAVLASVDTALPDEGWARLDAVAVLLDDLVDAARRQPESVEAAR